MACFGSPMSTSVRWPWKASRRIVPLHRVGVLELVDQHHPVARRAAAAAATGPSRRVGQGVAQPQQHVVVVDQAAAAACAASTSARTACAIRRAAPGRPVGRRRSGSSVGGRVGAPRRDRQRVELGPGHVGRLRAGRAPLAQVEVVGHLGHQVADALDQHRAGVVVAGGAEREQHLLAEAVRGGDGRGVEDRPVPRRAACAVRRRPPGRASASWARTRSSSGMVRRVRQPVARRRPGARGPARAARGSTRG